MSDIIVRLFVVCERDMLFDIKWNEIRSSFIFDNCSISSIYQ